MNKLAGALAIALAFCCVTDSFADPITDPSQLSPNPGIIDFEDFDTPGRVTTGLPNPVTFGDLTFTSLTGGGPSIFDISLSPGFPQDLAQLSSKNMFPGLGLS